MVEPGGSLKRVIDWDSGDDPDWILKWWKANTEIYPLMSQAERDYLAAQTAWLISSILLVKVVV